MIGPPQIKVLVYARAMEPLQNATFRLQLGGIRLVERTSTLLKDYKDGLYQSEVIRRWATADHWRASTAATRTRSYPTRCRRSARSARTFSSKLSVFLRMPGASAGLLFFAHSKFALTENHSTILRPGHYLHPPPGYSPLRRAFSFFTQRLLSLNRSHQPVSRLLNLAMPLLTVN